MFSYTIEVFGMKQRKNGLTQKAVEPAKNGREKSYYDL